MLPLGESRGEGCCRVRLGQDKGCRRSCARRRGARGKSSRGRAAARRRGALVDPEERKTLKALLKSRFAIDDDELRKILKEAEAWEHDSVDLYGFTSVLCRDLDQEGRQRIVEMLWEVVLADGVLHEFESSLVWRASELLGVSTHDRVRLRKLVESRA